MSIDRCTTPAKPLTADEIADLKANIDTQTIWYVRRESDMPDAYTYSECNGMPDVYRLIATIEQQAEQIEKLRQRANELETALERLIRGYGGRNAPIAKHRGSATYAAIQILDKDKALAATEPKP